MGRSVAVPSDAAETVYIAILDTEYDDGPFGFDDLIGDIQAAVRKRYPSFENADGWLGNEERVIARNDHALIVLCEYCGLASVSLVPNPDAGAEGEDLARAWCEQVGRNWRARLEQAFSPHAVRRVATASNGESFYKRAGA